MKISESHEKNTNFHTANGVSREKYVLFEYIENVVFTHILNNI